MTILERLIEMGEIRLIEDESGTWYYGQASDGVGVLIGDHGDEDIINEYLKTHAPPMDW